ncbi:hypothetical protein ASPTUDRAFT_233401 [Aspergillus tubingensis CBS 134.48]|uniref:Uncharacterized protein n=1 Tax=Aspergillus tubingensis (strain CBS 134.48) TaxID=767770 RepID=A0A1L9NME6_ASPTC|nr:hypothetical protein ASPTUDRAFT_233401 [Aspergillus tubingensis CBS 134.48]
MFLLLLVGYIVQALVGKGRNMGEFNVLVSKGREGLLLAGRRRWYNVGKFDWFGSGELLLDCYVPFDGIVYVGNPSAFKVAC